MSATVNGPHRGLLGLAFLLVLLILLRPVAVQAQGGAALDRTGGREIAALAPQIGLALRDGEILVGSPTIGIADYAESTERLARLLILGASPSLLDNPQWTLFFARTLPRREIDRYGDSSPYGQWRGNNQFQREDSRKAFLTRFRDRLLGMRPALPVVIADMRDVRLPRYDNATQQLNIEISTYSAWPSFGQLQFSAPLPFQLPKQWAMPPAEAWRIIEAAAAQTRPGFPPQATALLRYRLRDVRNVDGGVVLDLAALDITVYASRDLRTVIGRIPLPPDAITDAAPPTVTQSVPYIDPDYASIVAAALRPDLMTQDVFLREAYRLRRVSEQRVRRNYVFDYKPSVASWPMIVPASLIGSNADPSAADLAKLRDWLSANAAQLGDTVRLPSICAYVNARPNAPGHCRIGARKEGDRSQIDLAALVNFNAYDWRHASVDSDRARQLMQVAGRLAPEAVATYLLPSGTQLPAVVALAPHPAWFGVGIEADPDRLASATLDLTVAGKAIHQDERGRPFLLISVVPKTLTYTPAGTTAAKTLDFTQPPVRPTAASYDIFGVRIGMSLADAETAVKQALAIENLRRIEGRIAPGGRLAEFVRLERDEEGITTETVVLYFDGSQPNRPVLAVGRRLRIEEAHRSAAEAGLAGKYGPPDGTSRIDYGRRYWASDPVTKALIRAGMAYDHPCGHNDTRGFFEPTDTYHFSGKFLSRRCGEVLSARILDRDVEVVLTDSTRTLERHEARRAAETGAEAERRRAVPPIRF